MLVEEVSWIMDQGASFNFMVLMPNLQDINLEVLNIVSR